jgi:hypothetical protein
VRDLSYQHREGDNSTHIEQASVPANKALQVTPLRWAKFSLLGAALSHVMSHRVSFGGAPELGRWPAHPSYTSVLFQLAESHDNIVI